MHPTVRLLLLATAVQCINNGGGYVDDNVQDPHGGNSQFKSFLNMFGIGDGRQYRQQEINPDFNQFYPCALGTTTTTPAPTRYLCPFPPMLPSPNSVESGPPKTGNLVSLPPPPGIGHLPRPGQNENFPFPPPPNLHGSHPKPHPGQNPQLPPGFSPPPFPGQNPSPPIQNLPHPGPGQTDHGGKPMPPFPGSTLPHTMNPSTKPISDSRDPAPVDPATPGSPFKVDPIILSPFDPVKVRPTSVDPSKPVPINPVDMRPSSPILVDPIHPGKPHASASIKPGQPLIDPFRPPPNIDPKGFSNTPPMSPFGSMNVLINPGIPEKPFSLPPPPKPAPFRPPPSFESKDKDEIKKPINSPPPPLQGNKVPPYPPNVHPPKFPPPPTGYNPFIQFPKPLDSPPMCGNPLLKPYVPPGFHLSSVTQFIGVGPNLPPRVFEGTPCSTFDMLKKLEFKTMRSLLESSGLLPLLEHTKNYTLFIPSDAAFRRLPRWFKDSLNGEKKLMKAILLNHLVKEDLPLNRLENEQLVMTARPGGNRVRVNIYQAESSYRTITVDGSEVEKGDILTTNGRIHIVNKVLMPNLPRNGAQFLSEKLEFESFWNLVKQADMVRNFQEARPFTLFIPVNLAISKLNDSSLFSGRDELRNFINYHMINGTYYSNGLINNEFLLTNYEKEIKVQVVTDGFSKSLTGINGNVRILKSDITLTNGVAHVIEQCISEETPFYVYPQSDEFKNEYGVMRRSFRVTGEEKNIENAF